MPRRAIRARPFWEDRYTLPRRADLLSTFTKQQAALIQFVRDQLLGLPSVEETLSWRGIPWRWTLGYSLEGEADKPFAYLIPSPGRPIFAIPIGPGQLEAACPAKASRPVRDTIAGAMQVGGIRWPQWELTSRTLSEDLIAVARRQYHALLTPA
jgi:hypothetical protein